MTTTDSQQLLSDYAKSRSDAAFGELVTRYVDLVYSTAVRLVDGDDHRAKDVAQTVFLDLARDAAKLSDNPMLGGWLHRHTCFIAANVMRGERRRQVRERHAAELNAENATDTHFEHLAPILDEAINELDEEDRIAILLRFYEQRDLRSVGEALGGTENAAQKRVARALEQLHGMLVRRGIVFPAAALGTVLAGEAVTAAPTGLAAGILTTVLTGAAGGGSAVIVTKGLAAGKAKLALLGAILIGAVVPLVLQHRTHVRLEAENESLRNRLEQFERLNTDNLRLSNLVAQADSARELSSAQTRELLRLRGEVGRLRQSVREATELQARNSGPGAASAQSAGAPGTAKTTGKPEEIIPAGNINFPGISLDQFINFYGELAGAELDLDERVASLQVRMQFTTTNPVTRLEAVRLMDQALLDQAGIVVTHPDTNWVEMKLRR